MPNSKIENNKKMVELFQMNYNYQKNLELLKDYTQQKDYEKSIQILQWIISTEEGIRKVEALKIQGMVLFKTGKSVDAIQVLEEGLDCIIDEINENKTFYLQDFLLRLAMIYLDQHIYEIAYDYLLDEVFESDYQPFDYLTILGDIFFKQKLYLSAFDNYYKQISRLLPQNMNERIYTEFIRVSSKAVLCLICNEEQQILVKFIQYLIECTKSVVQNYEALNDENKYSDLKEIIIVEVLSLLQKKKQDSIFNYIINQIINRKLIKVNKLTKNKTEELFTILYDFNLKLSKLKNYGNQKNSFLNINNFLISFMSNIEADDKFLAHKVSTLFNQGIFYIQDGKEQEAQEFFTQCINLYQKEKEIGNSQQWNLFYHLGYKLYQFKMESTSLFFLRLIFQNQKDDITLTKKCFDLYAKCEYNIDNITNSPEYLEIWIIQNAQNYLSIKPKFFKNIFFLLILVWKNLSKKINIMKVLETLSEENQDYELMHYIYIIEKMLVYMRKKKLKENIDLSQKLREILVKFDFNSLLKILNEFYSTNILDKKYIDGEESIVLCLRNTFESFEDNVQIIKNFILNFYFLIINGASMNAENYISKNERYKLQSQINQLRDNEKFLNQVSKMYSSQGMSYENHNHSLQKDQPVSVKKIQKSQKIIPELQQQKKKKSIAVNRKFSEFKNLQDIELDKGCTCYKFKINNVSLIQKIEEIMQKFSDFDLKDEKKFLQNIKLLMESQKQTYQKYCYIPKLVDFFLLYSKEEFQTKKFNNMMKVIFEIKGICIHDFKNIFIIFNVFRDKKYFLNFYQYIYEEKHDWFLNLLEELMIKDIENENQKCFNFCLNEFSQKKWENTTVFSKLMEVEKNDKKITIDFKLKYSLMEEQNFLKQIQIKLGEKYLNELLIKYNFIDALHQWKNQTDFDNLFKKYTSNLNQILQQYKELNDQQYLFEFFFIVSLPSKFDPEQVEFIVEKFTEIMDQINSRDQLAFSQITIWFASYLFTMDYYNESSKIMSFAFQMIKQGNQSRKSRFEIDSQEVMIFQVFSFWYMCQVQLKNDELAMQCLNKLNDFQVSQNYIKNVLKLLNYFQLKQQGKKNLYERQLKTEDLNVDNQNQKNIIEEVKKFLLK